MSEREIESNQNAANQSLFNGAGIVLGSLAIIGAFKGKGASAAKAVKETGEQVSKETKKAAKQAARDAKKTAKQAAREAKTASVSDATPSPEVQSAVDNIQAEMQGPREMQGPIPDPLSIDNRRSGPGGQVSMFQKTEQGDADWMNMHSIPKNTNQLVGKDSSPESWALSNAASQSEQVTMETWNQYTDQSDALNKVWQL